MTTEERPDADTTRTTKTKTNAIGKSIGGGIEKIRGSSLTDGDTKTLSPSEVVGDQTTSLLVNMLGHERAETNTEERTAIDLIVTTEMVRQGEENLHATAIGRDIGHVPHRCVGPGLGQDQPHHFRGSMILHEDIGSEHESETMIESTAYLRGNTKNVIELQSFHVPVNAEKSDMAMPVVLIQIPSKQL